jgi:hypothetical protein
VAGHVRWAIAAVLALIIISSASAHFINLQLLSSGGGNTQGALSLIRLVLSFTTAAGTTGAPQTTTATNTGGVALAITSIGMTGVNASSFSQTNDCPATLVVAASPVVMVPRAHTRETTNVSCAVPETVIGIVQFDCFIGKGRPLSKWSVIRPTPCRLRDIGDEVVLQLLKADIIYILGQV